MTTVVFFQVAYIPNQKIFNDDLLILYTATVSWQLAYTEPSRVLTVTYTGNCNLQHYTDHYYIANVGLCNNTLVFFSLKTMHKISLTKLRA